MARIVYHLADIRLKNNAGITFPVCKAGARLLDMEWTGRMATPDTKIVDLCKRCVARHTRIYPWSSRVERKA